MSRKLPPRAAQPCWHTSSAPGIAEPCQLPGHHVRMLHGHCLVVVLPNFKPCRRGIVGVGTHISRVSQHPLCARYPLHPT